VAAVEIGRAQVLDLAEAPVAPAQIGEELLPRLGGVLRIAGDLVGEGPDRDLVAEESRIVVVRGNRRRISEVRIENGSM